MPAKRVKSPNRRKRLLSEISHTCEIVLALTTVGVALGVFLVSVFLFGKSRTEAFLIALPPTLFFGLLKVIFARYVNKTDKTPFV